jgi:hypothetical protein
MIAAPPPGRATNKPVMATQFRSCNRPSYQTRYIADMAA